MTWMPLSPCSFCDGAGSIPGIGGRGIPCARCEATGGGSTWARAGRAVLVLLHRGDDGHWRCKLALGASTRLRMGVGGREWRIGSRGTSVVRLGTTWDTLAEAQRGAEAAVKLLLEPAGRPAAGVEARAS